MKTDIAIIGAGPAGIGAGRRCAERSRASWSVYEATGRVGGLSSSRVDGNGFTWDLGGHVIFSSSAVFNAAVNEALGENALEHTRKSFIRMGKRFVPFPLQNNIHRLPGRAMRECLEGLVESAANPQGKPGNFEQWIVQNLGRGIAGHFMLPYNRKLWAFPLDAMGFGWIDGRVSVPSIGSIRTAIRNGADDHSWGPNAGFRFPLQGGTGGLFAGMAGPLRPNILLRHAVLKVDERKKKLFFRNGKRADYGRLISSAPLDILVKKLLSHPPKEIVGAASRLRSTSGWIVGVGFNRKITADRCWVYFPEEKAPFYRMTYFSNYSPLNVPAPGRQTSLLCEVSMGPMRKKSGSSVIAETVKGLVDTGVIRPADKKNMATVWKIRLPYLYPIPTLDRDDALNVIEEYLKAHGIYSVGRFGGWRYEKGNMDHAFLAGYEAAGLL